MTKFDVLYQAYDSRESARNAAIAFFGSSWASKYYVYEAPGAFFISSLN